MRIIRTAASFATILAGSTLFLASSLQSTGFAQISLDDTRFGLTATLDQLVTRDGEVTYDFSVSARPFLSNTADVESLIAPDGTIGAQNTFLGSHLVLGENLSLSDARAAFSGTWMFTERRGDELLAYDIRLPEITGDLFPETPTIVSPIPGDTVGPSFLLDWEFDSGAEPSGFSISAQGVGRGIVGREAIDNTAQKITVGFLPGTSESELTIRVGNGDTQPLDIVPVTPGANAEFSFDFLSIVARSAPVTVTVRVPEPTTAILMGFGWWLWAIRRGTRCRA